MDDLRTGDRVCSANCVLHGLNLAGASANSAQNLAGRSRAGVPKTGAACRVCCASALCSEQSIFCSNVTRCCVERQSLERGANGCRQRSICWKKRNLIVSGNWKARAAAAGEIDRSGLGTAGVRREEKPLANDRVHSEIDANVRQRGAVPRPAPRDPSFCVLTVETSVAVVLARTKCVAALSAL